MKITTSKLTALTPKLIPNNMSIFAAFYTSKLPTWTAFVADSEELCTYLGFRKSAIIFDNKAK